MILRFFLYILFAAIGFFTGHSLSHNQNSSSLENNTLTSDTNHSEFLNFRNGLNLNESSISVIQSGDLVENSKNDGFGCNPPNLTDYVLNDVRTFNKALAYTEFSLDIHSIANIHFLLALEEYWDSLSLNRKFRLFNRLTELIFLYLQFDIRDKSLKSYASSVKDLFGHISTNIDADNIKNDIHFVPSQFNHPVLAREADRFLATIFNQVYQVLTDNSVRITMKHPEEIQFSDNIRIKFWFVSVGKSEPQLIDYSEILDDFKQFYSYEKNEHFNSHPLHKISVKDDLMFLMKAICNRHSNFERVNIRHKSCYKEVLATEYDEDVFCHKSHIFVPANISHMNIVIASPTENIYAYKAAIII